MIQTNDAYNKWAGTYDTVENRTRDLEAKAIRSILKNVHVGNIIEIGCGTGKNTQWLSERCEHLTAIDFSSEMLSIAKEKIKDKKITFRQLDITLPWNFKDVDLISCSLILEHIENIDFIFDQAGKCLKPGGKFYICELHPYKQLSGSRAKFESESGIIQLEYFIHHISDFHSAALKHGFICEHVGEFFDNDDRNSIPRLISFIFSK
jgi:ubiquinone/menaquinone biosynthesis C-methylase UbiE